MKTSTEIAKTILTAGLKGFEGQEDGLRIINEMKLLIEDYAKSYAKAKLEEAAERTDEKRKVKFPSLVFEAYNNGIDDAIESITNTSLD